MAVLFACGEIVFKSDSIVQRERRCKPPRVLRKKVERFLPCIPHVGVEHWSPLRDGRQAEKKIGHCITGYSTCEAEGAAGVEFMDLIDLVSQPIDAELQRV